LLVGDERVDEMLRRLRETDTEKKDEKDDMMMGGGAAPQPAKGPTGPTS
jgi:hypothetical protein